MIGEYKSKVRTHIYYMIVFWGTRGKPTQTQYYTVDSDGEDEAADAPEHVANIQPEDSKIIAASSASSHRLKRKPDSFEDDDPLKQPPVKATRVHSHAYS